MHSESIISRNTLEISNKSGSPGQPEPLGHSWYFLLILEAHTVADIPAWGISLREVLISPHAEWSRGLEGKIKCFGEGKAGEHCNENKVFVGLRVFTLVFLSL